MRVSCPGARSPRGSKYPVCEASGSKNRALNGIWDQKLQNIGYLDPLAPVLSRAKLETPSVGSPVPYEESAVVSVRACTRFDAGTVDDRNPA